MEIKLSYYFNNEPLFRQTPGGAGLWKGHTFVGNAADQQNCDFWVVLEDTLNDEETCFVRSGRTVLITLEPPLTGTILPAF